MARSTGRGSRAGQHDGRFTLAKSHGGDFDWSPCTPPGWWAQFWAALTRSTPVWGGGRLAPWRHRSVEVWVRQDVGGHGIGCRMLPTQHGDHGPTGVACDCYASVWRRLFEQTRREKGSKR